MFSMRERGWLALEEVTVISGAHSDGEVGSDAHKIYCLVVRFWLLCISKMIPPKHVPYFLGVSTDTCIQVYCLFCLKIFKSF